MTELQAAIEAAGLPEPTAIDMRWETLGGHVMLLVQQGMVFGYRYQNCTHLPPVLIGHFVYPTAAEAVAVVRSWMDEQ